MQPRISWETADHPLYLCNRLNKLFIRKTEAALRDHGLGTGWVPVLRVLSTGEAKTQTELALAANIEQPTMYALLGRMARAGMVKRSAHPEDKRSSLYALTPTGMARALDAHAAVQASATDAMRGFSTADLRQLRTLLERAIANLEIDGPVPTRTSRPRRPRTR